MFTISNFTENDDVQMLDALGAFQVIEWKRDLSVTPESSVVAYFSSEMNVRRRQVICDLSQAPVTIQAGAMQWMLGDVNATTGIKGVGDLLGKAVRGKVTGESAIKPEYTGSGILVLEPTYRHLLLLDAADWGGSVVLDDGLFEVILVRKPTSITDLTDSLQALIRQEPPQSGAVLSFHASHLKFTAEKPIPWTLDGEYGGSHEINVVENCRQALTVMQGD